MATQECGVPFVWGFARRDDSPGSGAGSTAAGAAIAEVHSRDELSQRIYPIMRRTIGSVLGWTEDLARSFVTPQSPFNRIDDDVIPEDLSEAAALLERALQFKGLPRPSMEQTVDAWLARVVDVIVERRTDKSGRRQIAAPTVVDS